MEGRRKRKQSSVADIPKRKRIITHSATSEEEDDSSEIDTDSGSEEVFESTGPRFRIRTLEEERHRRIQEQKKNDILTVSSKMMTLKFCMLTSVVQKY